MADMAMHSHPRVARANAPREGRSANTKAANPGSAEEQGKRLTEVRIKAGYRTRQEAADALGEPVASYHLRENGHRRLTGDVAKRYAEFFGVTPQWLLYGETGVEVRIPVRGVVGPDGVVLKARAKTKETVVEPPKEPTQRFAPFIVRDRGSMPMCHDGDTLYYDETAFNGPVNRDAVSGRKCMVQTGSGATRVAVIINIDADGKANLHLPSGKYLRDVPIRHAAPILWTRHATEHPITC
jgi:hypothetical protein